jgi:hypothetical protein
MRKALVAAAMGLAGFATGPVQAMEIVPLSVPGSNVTLVAGGCGIGFHRGPYGGCRPNGYGGGYGVVGAHPYGWHGGAYGWHGGGYHYGWHGGGGGYHYGPHGGGYHYHY